MNRRAIALLLAVAMTISLCVLSAFAAVSFLVFYK